MLALVVACLGVLVPGTEAQEPAIGVRIQVIEATKKSETLDPKLEPLRKNILNLGWKGAKLLDELETAVEPKATISLDILNKQHMLKVTVLSVENDTVKLKVEIPEFKFSANTTHKKGMATVLVAKDTGPDTALFLAVTPKI